MEFTDIKGFKDKRIQMLKEAGINTPADLLLYFPSYYLYLNRLADLSKAEEGERVVILARTFDKPKAAYLKKRLSVVKVKFDYAGKNVWCSWFNQPFMAKNIMPETYYYIYGKLKKYKSSYEITAPKIIKFTGSEPAVLPVYKPIGKIGSQLLADAVKTALSAVSVESFITPRIAEKYGLSDLNSAFKNIHFPQTAEDIQSAKRVISTEKLAYMLAAYSLIRSSHDLRRVYNYGKDINKVADAINGLPYDLTSAQKNCLNKIFNGLSSNERLNVLLEGDVGCGKTIVAFLCMYYAALNGYQSVLMAPTEILAFQHYRNAIDFLEKLGLRCEYVSSSLNKKEREKAIFNISAGNVDCVFGTHAVLGDDVEFRKLALVIVDEQHRFGVAQRAGLENKSKGADSIVMSATPIPRTLALTLYGDLERIVIDEMPSRKAEVITKFVPAAKESDMWDYIMKKAESGEQTYVVVPRISDDDEDNLSAEAVYEKYKKGFGDKIALLHGRQKESVKNGTMRAFAAGEITVLVATTVIEVGIDVKNATSMVIYDADRFGLAQLHQLRGRVGRGSKTSYCFVLSDTADGETRNRLDYFVGCKDGFSLAEYDFRNRGAGDFLGYVQHGTGDGLLTDPDIVFLSKSVKDELLSDSEAVKKIKNSLAGGRYEFFNGITLN